MTSTVPVGGHYIADVAAGLAIGFAGLSLSATDDFARSRSRRLWWRQPCAELLLLAHALYASCQRTRDLAEPARRLTIEKGGERGAHAPVIGIEPGGLGCGEQAWVNQG